MKSTRRAPAIQQASVHSPPLKRHRQPVPVALVITADIVLAAIGLMIFALFHHGLPREFPEIGQVLSSPTTTADAVTTPNAVSTAGSPETASVKITTQSIATSGQTSPITTADSSASTAGSTAATSASTAQAAPTPADSAVSGAWGSKFAEKFTDGRIEQTDAAYHSANISLELNKVQVNKVTYFVADIFLRDIHYFRTAFAGNKYARSVTDEVLDMALANNAILAISGDYYGIRDRGIVIRNGILYRTSLFEDVLVMNNDGSMQTFSAKEFDIASVKANGAWQAWSFGPMLLKDGQAMTSFNSSVTGLNPRGAIGYYEPGHYCFVLVDGRQDGYSVGMTMKQLSKLFQDLGCQVAYNLDGGQSAVMTFMDQWANQPYRGGRKISDIIFIAE